MSLYATNIWESPTGLSHEFNFAGGYLDPNHVKVESEDKTSGLRTALPFRFLNNHTVSLYAPVPANARLWIYRETPVNSPIADFTNGSRMTEANLDTATQQSIFAVAELYDRIALGLGGKGFTAATTEITTEAAAGQAVFPTPTYAATDTLVVTANQLRIHPVDVARTSSSTVTIPPQPAGVFVTVEVTRMLPIASAPVLPPGGSAYGQNLGAGNAVYKTTVGDALQFRTLLAGANMTITQEADTLTFNSTAGGGGVSPSVTTVLGSATLDNSTPNGRIEYLSTPAGGWNTGVGMCTVDMEVQPTNYFSSNPGGHVAFVTRCNTGVIATNVSGQGVIFGNMVGIGGAEGAPFIKASQIETWEYPDTGGNRWLFPETSGGPGAQMVDGQRYRFIIDTSKWYDGQRYIRYRRYIRNVAMSCWDLEVDTGSVLDHNVTTDLTHTGLVLGHVFGSGGAGWNVVFSNVTVTWGPPAMSADARRLLNRTGGDVLGDVTFKQGADIRMDTSGADPAVWARVLPASGDVGRLVAAPGVASGQSIVASLNSDTSNTGYVAMSALPTHAVINTSKLGTGTVPELRIGYDTQVQLTARSTGMYVGNSPLPLGNAPIYTYLYNPGGFYATQFANIPSVPFDIESVCTNGTIAAFLTGPFTAPQASSLENILRPLYCLLSTLIATTRNKGTA